ncbi:MAG: tRNA epoxyqueuosine(34) reductase QueG [Candidatus Latescibacterota bacterium]|nr:MAG: tRNA epoxyqueuosine(34) reductase QueG [Candidatus Latescibacterota bacterium]
MLGMMDRSERIRAQAREAGFQFVGVVTADRAPQAELLNVWLERGMHGTMTYMEDPDGRRADPRAYVPWARTLVIVALSYYTPQPLSLARERGAISRYAWGRDYHGEVRARLERLRAALEELSPGCRTHPFVDTSPILEKGLAEAAGLGWRGKHTNLLRKRQGSWFFLGGLATDLDLRPDAPARDHCGTCTACIDVCPTRAIVAPYVLDARLCISYLTIERRGPIPRSLRPQIGNRIFGCDDCQDVCPWNRFAQVTPVEAFQPRDGNLNPPLIELVQMTRGEWNRRFKRTAIRRAHYEGFLRNVAVALGNGGSFAAVAPLVARLDDASSLVRGHAAWALGRIRGPRARTALVRRRRSEEDPWVREEIELALQELEQQGDDARTTVQGDAQ